MLADRGAASPHSLRSSAHLRFSLMGVPSDGANKLPSLRFTAEAPAVAAGSRAGTLVIGAFGEGHFRVRKRALIACFWKSPTQSFAQSWAGDTAARRKLFPLHSRRWPQISLMRPPLSITPPRQSLTSARPRPNPPPPTLNGSSSGRPPRWPSGSPPVVRIGSSSKPPCCRGSTPPSGGACSHQGRSRGGRPW
jgi:hypothetical protein